MPVPSAITDLSTVASSNPPGGGETPAEGDNHIRAAYSFIAALRDILNGTTSATATIQTLLVSGASAFTGTATFNGALVANGNVTLGNASGDTVSVVAIASFAEAIAAARGIAAGNTAVTAVSVLDYYLEEPAWTPEIVGSGTAGTTTYTSRAGSYTRVGNRVMAQFEVLISAQTGSGSFALTLPVTAKVSSISTAPLGSGYVNTAAPFAEIVEIQTATSDGTKALFEYKSGTSINHAAVYNGGCTIKGHLVYEAA